MLQRQMLQLTKLVKLTARTVRLKQEYLKRLDEGRLTRDENPESHFCVYFAGYDPKARRVFIGLHKKSRLWLFNGGHLDKGELVEEALMREIREEWEAKVKLSKGYKPKFLTITKIKNPTRQTCRLHYDIWYFVPLDKNSFSQDMKLMEKEFDQARWMSVEEARGLVTDPNTLSALEKIEKLFIKD